MSDFILQIPHAEPDNYFTYDIIVFLLLWVFLAAAILLCFWGYRYLQTMTLLLLGCLCGVIGITIGESMTSNPILKMSFFVMFTFLGVCILYFISILISTLFRKSKIRKKLRKKMYLFTAVLGAFFSAAIIYLRIFHNLAAVIVFGLVLAVAGILYGKKRTELQKPFHTYDELYRMEPVKEGEADA